MLYGNQMENELLKRNLIDRKQKIKPTKHKKFKCHKCGAPMIYIDNTNTMACSNCNQYFIFDKS